MHPDENGGHREAAPAVPVPPPSTPVDAGMAAKSWTWGIGHNYIGLFLGVIFLDRLAPGTLGVGGLVPSVLGAALGGLLAFGLLYLPAATWGFRARLPLADLARSTFGERGAIWVPGLLLGLAQVVWFAAALALAADYGARGLLELGMLDAASIADIQVGGLTLRAPVILFETVCWGLFAAVMGTFAVRIVSAVMFTYPVFPALALGFALFWTLPGIGFARTEPATMPMPGADAALGAFLVMVQIVGGFFVTSGLLAADWGVACRRARDVTLGGFVGITLAATVFAAITLAIVADTIGPVPSPEPPPKASPAPSAKTTNEERLAALLNTPAEPASPPRTPPPEAAGDRTLASALQYGIGGSLGGSLLLVFALGLLGPCAYAPYLIVRQVGAAFPRVPRLAIAIAAVVAAWPLVATGLALDLGTIFGLMGAVFGPIAGAIAADFLLGRGAWRGARSGWNLPGLAAWILGMPVGLLPMIGRWSGIASLENAQPATYLAFATGFFVFLGLATLGLGSPRVDTVPRAGS